MYLIYIVIGNNNQYIYQSCNFIKNTYHSVSRRCSTRDEASILKKFFSYSRLADVSMQYACNDNSHVRVYVSEQ